MWPIPRPAARLFSLLPAILTVALMGAPAQAHTVVRFVTNLGEFDVDLYDSTMPTTVANFLAYVTTDRYASTIFHRSTTYNPTDIQIVQGGGFLFDNNLLLPVEADPPIPLEPSSANLRGTLAMARTSDPNSATSQWYFNVTDNPGLDFSYAVFGDVIGTGLDVIDAIGAVPVYDASAQLGSTFSQLPLLQPSLEAQSLVLVESVSVVELWEVTIDVPSGTQTQEQAGYPMIATAASVTKTGLGTLVYNVANSYPGPTTVSAGTLEIANQDAVAGSRVTVDPGATLRAASCTLMRSPEVVVDGGTLSAVAIALNATTGITSLAINAGTLADSPLVAVGSGGEMTLAPDARVVVAVGGLSVDESGPGGRVDLGGGQVTVAAGGISAANLRADIIAGRNGGAWDGTTGIMSSAAAASGGTRGVGYVVANDGSARISYAAAGDVDLSGQVNVFDLVSINSAGKYGTGTPADWSQGDFNYDGVTNVFDLVGINTAAAYGQGNYFPASPTSAGSMAAVPEPSAWLLGLTGLAAIAAVAGRRRVSGVPNGPLLPGARSS